MVRDRRVASRIPFRGSSSSRGPSMGRVATWDAGGVPSAGGAAVPTLVVSVPIVISSYRRVLLPILVLVGHLLVARSVEGQVHGRRNPAHDLDHHARLAGSLVPDAQLTSSFRHAVNPKKPGLVHHGKVGGVQDHDVARHLRVDVAVYAHETRGAESPILGLPLVVKAEIELRTRGATEDVVEDLVEVGKDDGASPRHRDDVGLTALVFG